MISQKLHVSVALIFGLLAMAGLLALMGTTVGGPPAVQAQGGNIHYVAPGGNCGGASPCYGSIQDAVDAASDSDVIKVATGTYTDVYARWGITQVVYIDKSVTIQGGYITIDWTTPDPDAHPTTLDAQGQGRVLHIRGDISPAIEGLRITGGATDSAGGGIRIEQAQATISNCHIFSNTADWGGGVALWNSPASLNDNTVTGNMAHAGGGLALGDSPAILTDNTVTGNTATSSGGGLYLSSSDARLSRNTISSNGTSQGLLLWGSNATLDANIITGNGSGVFLHASFAELTNNIVADNLSDGICIEGSSPRFLHNTIARNYVGVSIRDRWEDGTHYTSTVVLTNTILVSNDVGIDVNGGNTATVNGVLWYSTPITVSHATTATVTIQNQHTGDPAFDTDGYHLLTGSAAIDKGVNAGITVDIDGEPRPAGAYYDLGADEFWYKIYLPLVLRSN